MASFSSTKGRQWRIHDPCPFISSPWRRRRFSCVRLLMFGTTTSTQNFVNFIAANPEAGDVIPETGGVRKVRWSRSGTGKRGGARVIYFYHSGSRPLYLLLVYAKARREDLTPDEKRLVRKLAAMLKR